MYPIPPTEILVQTKTCRHCQAFFPITDKDLEFYEKISPVFPAPLSSEGEGLGVRREWNKIRYLIPTPTLCPDCRQQRRLSFRNERKLYKRNCDAIGKSIISIYSPDKPFKVYHQDYWWSDKWDPMDYGREFDFNRGFFEQFGELMGEVPRIEKLVMESENCEYNNIMGHCKDCYMCSTTFQSEKAFYSYWCVESGDCMDMDSVWRVQDCYECVNCNNSRSLFFSENTIDASGSHFLFDCVGCHNCFLCSSLYNKSYCILNQQYSQSEYERKVAELQEHPISFLQNAFLKLKNEATRKYLTSQNANDSTGDYIFNCSNAKGCFNVTDGEDIKYCYDSAVSLKSGMDMSMIGDVVELMLEAHASGYGGYKSAFVNLCWTGKELLYCDYCMYCSNCFWCIGLRNKQYCILNKQYTKEEYEALVPRIIEHMMKTGEWGEFFPSSLSPFGYNETVAMEYYPLTREEVLKNPPWERGKERSDRGIGCGGEVLRENGGCIKISRPSGTPSFQKGNIFNWSDYEAPFPKVEKIIPADKLPDDISKIPDDILNWAIECEVTKKPFRIIKQELEFYRKHNLPIPRRHPDQRHLDRMALRNPRKLFERKCDKCGVEMVTTYAPDRKEVVYCEKCYEKEVVG